MNWYCILWEDFAEDAYSHSVFLLSGAGTDTGSVGGNKINEKEKVCSVHVVCHDED